jgi:hypothetical protein
VEDVYRRARGASARPALLAAGCWCSRSCSVDGSTMQEPHEAGSHRTRLALLGRALLVVVLLLECLYLVDLARPGASPYRLTGCCYLYSPCSKADPRQQQDWILRGLQGGRVHPLAACEVATVLCFPWKPKP